MAHSTVLVCERLTRSSLVFHTELEPLRLGTVAAEGKKKACIGLALLANTDDLKICLDGLWYQYLESARYISSFIDSFFLQ